MSSSEHLLESLLTSLCTVLQYGLGALHDPPTRERAAAMSEGLFNKVNIPLISQVNSLMIGYIFEVHSFQSFSLHVELVVINS